MKIILLMLLAIIAMISLSACSSDSMLFPNTEETEPSSPATTPEDLPATAPSPTVTVVLPTITTLQQEFATEKPLKGNWTVFKDSSSGDNEEDNAALKYINIIQCDESGRLWFASDGRGLTMYDGQNWYNWQPETRLNMEYGAIRSMAVYGNKVYAGGYSSSGDDAVMIYDIEQDEWNTISYENGQLSGVVTWGIAVDSEGRIYIPTIGGILDTLDDKGDWEHINMTPLPPYYQLEAEDAMADTDGNYWIATYGHGIWKYADGTWTKYGGIPEEDWAKPEDGWLARPAPSQGTYRGGAPSFGIALSQDRTGQLWVASTYGLAVKTLDDHWTMYTNDELDLGDRWIGDILVDYKNRLWVISMNNLLVFDGNTWLSFTPDAVGEQYWGGAIGLDNQGNIWVEIGGRDGGIAMFEEEY